MFFIASGCWFFTYVLGARNNVKTVPKTILCKIFPQLVHQEYIDLEIRHLLLYLGILASEH